MAASPGTAAGIRTPEQLNMNTLKFNVAAAHHLCQRVSHAIRPLVCPGSTQARGGDIRFYE